MKYINTFCSLFILLCFSCNDPSNKDSVAISSKEKELQLKERELEIRERELKNKESAAAANEKVLNSQTSSQSQFQQPIEKQITKFIYVTFKVQQPVLHHTDSRYFDGDGIRPPSSFPEINSVSFEDYIYTSEIKEIEGYDDDRQYEYMDKMENELSEKINYINLNFSMQISSKVRDIDEQQKLKDNIAKIVDRKMKTFISYKEASIYRSDNKGKF
jgi:hypothetical protein